MKNLTNYRTEDLVLKQVDVKADVVVDRVMATNTQYYKNPFDEAINITYVFPINHNAAVCSFIVDINGEKFEAELKEKEEANKIQEEEKIKGNTAAVLENRNSNFLFNIVNVPSGADIIIEIKYIFTLEEKNKIFRLNLPTTIGVKYHNDMDEEIVENRIKPKYESSSSYLYNFDIKMYHVDNIEVKSEHDIKVMEEENYTLVKSSSVIPNRDFVLEYTAEKSNYMLTSKSESGDTYSYVSCLYDKEESFIHNKKYVFIMDNSGSMGGRNLIQAKNALKLCIRNLDETDKFNIVFFNSSFYSIFDDFVDYNDENLKIADDYIDEVRATGGTEISGVLSKYCKYKDATLMLFTDGQVYNVDAVYRVIKDKAEGVRLFSFGIDDSIDVDFINKMAKYGEGRSEFLNTSEEIYEKTINQMMASMQEPYVCKIESSVDVTIKKVFGCDSFSDVVFGNINSLTIDEKQIDIIKVEDNDLYDFLRTLYFKKLIDKNEKDEKECIKNSLLGKVLCPYTSFILVKKNKKGIFAKRDEIVGNMIPYGDEHLFLDNSMLRSCRVTFDCMSVNSVSFMNSSSPKMSMKQKKVDRQKVMDMQREAMNSISYNCNYQSPSTGRMLMCPDEIKRPSSDQTRLLELFMKQKADGSIDGDVDLTREAVELYEKLGKPSTYKMQYKKALKYLKKNK